MPNELFIYDVIGEGLFESGVTAKSVRDEMKGFDKGKPIDLLINSPGGYLTEAVAIMAALNQWEAGVNVRVDGLAASAASYIAMMGSEIAVTEGSFIMIHNPYTVAMGDANEMRKVADFLDKAQAEIAKAYATRSGKTVEEVKTLLDAETWFTADEAIAAGFADRKIETVKAAAFKIPASFNFKHVPSPEAAVIAPQQRAANKLAALQRQLDLSRAAIA